MINRLIIEIKKLNHVLFIMKKEVSKKVILEAIKKFKTATTSELNRLTGFSHNYINVLIKELEQEKKVRVIYRSYHLRFIEPL